MESQKKSLPGQFTNESIEDYVKRTWNSDPDLQDEFSGDFETYAAFCRADAADSIRILGQTEKSD